MPFGDTPGLAVDRGRPDFMMPVGDLITSALSNKGNATGYGQDNTFRVRADQQIRMFDNEGNLLFSGIGPEAAKQAVAMGQNLSDTLGRKADWTIQTGDQYTNTDGTTGTRWNDVAHEKKNLSTLGKIGKVVGTALPLAVSLIPGLQVLGPVISSVVAGGAGAAMAGRDPIKGALTAGLTAGGGEFLGPILQGAGIGLDAANAIGTGLGATAGGLATGQNLKNSLLSGAAAGGLSYLGGQVFKPEGGLPASDAGISNPGDLAYGTTQAATRGLDNLLADISGTAAANVAAAGLPTSGFGGFGGSSSSPTTSVSPTVTPTPSSGLTVTGTRLPVSTGFNAGALNTLLPAPRYSGDGPTPSEILVNAQNDAPAATDSKSLAVLPAATTPSEIIVNAQNDVPATTENKSLAVVPATPSEILVNARNDVPAVRDDYTRINPVVPDFNADLTVTAPKKDVVTVEDKPLAVPIDVGSTLATVDNNPDTTNVKDKGLTTEQKLKLAALALSTLGGLGGGGGSGGSGTIPGGLGQLRSPVFDQKLSVLTPEQNRAKYGARNMTGTDWATWGSRPATSFFQNVEQQPTGMAHGGSLAAKRGGRSSFAVNGPGTGRSDDIPAVLSDGEYVIDAETVALLGDGSSKAGAKKLDDLRVKVRKHKGKKLAQGRFSANAKDPEAYLSGGRA